MHSHLELPRRLAASCRHLWTIAMATIGQPFYASHCLGAVLSRALLANIEGTLLYTLPSIFRTRPEVSGIGDFSSKCPRNPLKQKLSRRGAAGSSEVGWGRCPAKQQMGTKNVHLSSSPLGGISLPSTARLRMLQQTRTRVLNRHRTQ